MVYTEEKKKILGDNIWMRREALSIPREVLADKLQIAKETLGKWENGHIVPNKKNLSKLTKILKCSKHDLHRPCSIPKISVIEEKEVVEKKEEPVMCDADIIKAASEAFKNSYTETSIETVEKYNSSHPVVERVNKYLADNDMSQNELARRLSMSSASLNRVVHGVLLNDNPKYAKVEKYLDNIEKTNANNNIENVRQLEIKFEEPIKEQKIEENKSVEKASLSERLNGLYDTLFNTLAELDELKQDIAKIEKVTAMLKEIQGL